MRVVYARNVGLDANGIEGDVGLVLTRARHQRFKLVLAQAKKLSPNVKFLAIVDENDDNWWHYGAANAARLCYTLPCTTYYWYWYQ